MKILVTGGKGKIGQEACIQLREIGHDVVVFDRALDEDHDIQNPESLKSFFAEHGPEVVVHLAAWPWPMSLSFQDYVDNNVIGTFNVAEASLEFGVRRFVFTSSTAYYGYERSLTRPLPILNEDVPSVIHWAAPNEQYQSSELWYGISKIAAETLLAYYGLSQQFEVIILRLAPVPRHMELGLKIEKAAEAICLAVNHPHPLWYEIFNIATKPGLGIDKARQILGFEA